MDALNRFYEASRVPDPDGMTSQYPGVFVLGCLERSVSFLPQQTRAVNLIAALEARGTLEIGQRLAVVGAGIAGLTAAAYACVRGHSVTVLERRLRPLSIQEGSSRWIHPNINMWPKPGWKSAGTLLPVMNWSAGPAKQVVATLRQEWNDVSSSFQPAFESLAAPTLNRLGNHWRLLWESGEMEADVVILAVGFGEEENHPDIKGASPYWRDSDLHQQLPDGGCALVSGCGDGGLIDSFRVLFEDFQHEWLAEFGASMQTASDQISAIEADHDAIGDPVALTRAYRAIAVPEAVVEMVSARVRGNTLVTLNARGEAPFDRGSAPIHRMLAAVLMNLNVMDFVKGSLLVDKVTQVGEKQRVPIDANGTTLHQDYDLVVVRHGPRSSLDYYFGDIANKVTPTRTHNRQRPALSDATCLPLWRRGQVKRNDDQSDVAAIRTTPIDESGWFADAARLAETTMRRFAVAQARSKVTSERNGPYRFRVTAVLEKVADALPGGAIMVLMVRGDAGGRLDLDLEASTRSGIAKVHKIGRSWRSVHVSTVISMLAAALTTVKEE